MEPDLVPERHLPVPERPRTGLIIFILSALTGIAMFVVAAYAFDPDDDRSRVVSGLGVAIELVGIGWSIVLMARAKE